MVASVNRMTESVKSGKKNRFTLLFFLRHLRFFSCSFETPDFVAPTFDNFGNIYIKFDFEKEG